MTTRKRSPKKTKLAPFDPAKYLTSNTAIAEYISAALEDGDPDLLIAALNHVARARGMAQLAKRSGLGRESLYKALTPGAKTRFDTILRVVEALGMHLRATTHPRAAA
ncbi:MAG: putative addiction module antidote protein [Deltaproteobacteria bacterium]|nr:putative addiction module antidote protein [Deltaproteobacteria bacterium]